MTVWDAFVQADALQVGVVVIFVEQLQTHDTSPHFSTGDAGNLQYISEAPASFVIEAAFLIEDTSENRLLLLDRATDLRWMLSPASEEEEALAPLDTPRLIRQVWQVRAQAGEP
jgi:hypothetical protein